MIKSFLHRTRVNFFKLLSFFDIKVHILILRGIKALIISNLCFICNFTKNKKKKINRQYKRGLF